MSVGISFLEELQAFISEALKCVIGLVLAGLLDAMG